jgi:hypothetical protein
MGAGGKMGFKSKTDITNTENCFLIKQYIGSLKEHKIDKLKVVFFVKFKTSLK